MRELCALGNYAPRSSPYDDPGHEPTLKFGRSKIDIAWMVLPLDIIHDGPYVHTEQWYLSQCQTSQAPVVIQEFLQLAEGIYLNAIHFERVDVMDLLLAHWSFNLTRLDGDGRNVLEY